MVVMFQLSPTDLKLNTPTALGKVLDSKCNANCYNVSITCAKQKKSMPGSLV